MKNLTRTICLTLAVLLGGVGTSWGADFQKGVAAVKSGDFATALREWRPFAEQGYASAQVNLGFMYDKGYGVLQDYKTAMKWYTLAAEQGNPYPQTNLGWMYHNGRSVIGADVILYETTSPVDFFVLVDGRWETCRFLATYLKGQYRHRRYVARKFETFEYIGGRTYK